MTTPHATINLDWNEILIARLDQGQMTCWTAWRRAISAFNDPTVWENPDVWATHFTQQPEGSGWGFQGYGLIAVDMDRKTVWSVNDYAVPGSVYLPSVVMIEGDAETTQAGLRGLVQRPDMWPHVHLNVARQSLLGKREMVMTTLDQVLSPSMNVQSAMACLTLPNTGNIQVRGKPHMFLQATLNMPGWTVHTDRGQEPEVQLLTMLTTMQDTGWPSPDWNNVHERAQTMKEDMSDEEVQAFETAMQTLHDRWEVLDLTRVSTTVAPGTLSQPRR